VSGVNHFELQIGHRGDTSSVEIGSDPSSTCFLSTVPSPWHNVQNGLLCQAGFCTMLYRLDKEVNGSAL